MLGRPASHGMPLAGGSAEEQAQIARVTRPHKDRHVQSTLGGEQLQMFMTPREIKAKYEPAFGDREITGATLVPHPTIPGAVSPRVTVETDEQLWNRKASEARHSPAHGQYSADDLLERMGTPSPVEQRRGESMTANIARQGVQHPVHLSMLVGPMGRRMMAGGQHRVAAAAEVAPDQPIPVLHHETILHAQQQGPYT
jgi:hypothetical protein